MNKLILNNGKVLGDKLYFIADIGANHDGDLERAFKLIELAKKSGAHAAKFQHFQASKIVSRKGFEDLKGQLGHQASWKKSVYEIYEDASISENWTPLLKRKCDEVGIDFFTSPYDFQSVDAVDPFIDVYKIGSGDITWLEIIEYIAKKNKPVLIATGASDMSEVRLAMELLQKYCSNIVLMQCNTDYTLDQEKYKYVNLNVLKTFSKEYPKVVLGLSDHTTGMETVLGAIALGATVIEKHFTDSNEREGPDHKFAMNPQSWATMVEKAEILFSALGDGIKKLEENEKKSVIVQRRCLRAVRNIEKGEIIKAMDFEALRPIPLDGIPPYHLNRIEGFVLNTSLKAGEHITFNHIK